MTRELLLNPDPVFVARSLLGSLLVTEFEGKRTVGRIVETEAYKAPEDKASHAHGGKLTKRNAPMYRQGGISYVYLCYGIHHLFNVVSGPEDHPHAILVRGLEPVEGVDIMLERRGMQEVKRNLSAGPGLLTQALGIKTRHTNLDLLESGNPLRLEKGSEFIPKDRIIASPRVGVDYAGHWAAKPWRFRIKDNLWTSPAK